MSVTYQENKTYSYSRRRHHHRHHADQTTERQLQDIQEMSTYIEPIQKRSCHHHHKRVSNEKLIRKKFLRFFQEKETHLV